MATKQHYVDEMNRIIGTAEGSEPIRWEKMSRDDLRELHRFFANPKLVVVSFAERLEEEELQEVLRVLSTTEPTASPAGDRGALLPTLDEVLQRRPMIRRLLMGD